MKIVLIVDMEAEQFKQVLDYAAQYSEDGMVVLGYSTAETDVQVLDTETGELYEGIYAWEYLIDWKREQANA